ncbi:MULTISPECIES: hypothetical protein [unclassified Isoptericola]|uniref:hypothetical protein n=1 Tax=unclassified Isoptericola TaxID=2623355 RepID=UPI00365128B8
MDATLLIGIATAALTFVVLRAGRAWRAVAAILVLAACIYGLTRDDGDPPWLVPFVVGAGVAFLADVLVSGARALGRAEAERRTGT